LFDKATIQLPGGKSFVVTARNNGMQKPYIREAHLNGEKLDRSFISHDELGGGGNLVFEMTSAPDYKWAVKPESHPPSALAHLLGEMKK
jgi:putative alpha-1,2-mannosidase